MKFIEDNTVLKGAVSLDPSNLNTKKPISIEIGPSKLEPYESSSDSKLDKPLPDKPINPPITNKPLDNSDLILEGDEIQLDYYKLLAKTSSYILSFVYKARKRVISKDSTPTTYKQVLKLPRDERSRWLEAITKEFIRLLELGVFKFLLRSLLPSNYKLITCQNVLKVKKDAKNRPIKYKSQLVARGFIQVEGLDYTVTYASTRAFLNSALREEIYIEIPKGLLDRAASNKAIYKLVPKYSYNPSTPNIIKLSKALYSLKQSPREWQDKLEILLKSLGYLALILDLGVFYNARTYHFIVTYIDDCLFIGPDIGYITDLKKQLNKVYAIEDLGPAAYFLGYVEEAVSRFNLADSKPISIPLQPGLLSRSLNRPTKLHLNAAKNLFKYLNSTKDYSICFSYNGNIVADLGPKLSNSSNTTTKLSRDFFSKEGPRPLTTTSTTIVDSRNSKGSSRTSIINSSLVPIGFSDSDFAGDKGNSKSTYGYLYKLASRPISWNTKRATTIALFTLKAETDGLTEAIREVQWIIGLFSELYRPIDHPITLYGDNQGSIIVANNPALYVRTKHTLLKFRYVREQVKAKIVTIIYLNTKCIPADGLTKALPDSISAIKNISSTLTSLTNSSNTTAATTGKTSYSPRFDPFSGTRDLDSPLCPPRKEPHLGPAVDNTATSNLDPPIDIGSKEGFKDTITSSIVKELSKKAYTIPDYKNPDISNTYSDSNQAVLLMLLRNSLSSSPRAAISWIYIPSKAFKLLVRQYSRPIESKKEDVYNEFHARTFSTYKKGLSAFNAEFNSYLAKLTIAKIDIDPSLILDQYYKALARMLGLIASSLNIEYLIANILEESRNPAIEAYRAAYIANSSNSTPNSNSNPSKKGKNKKKGKKKASYNVKGQNYNAKSAEQASFILRSYNLAIEEEKESNSTSNSSSSSDSNTQLAQLLALKGYKKRKDFKGKGLKTSSNNKAKYKDNQPRRRPSDPAFYNSWLYNTGSTDHISNSKERFTTFTPNTGQLCPINTGNSPISPASIGSITLEVLSRKAPPTYTKLVLDNVLYLPNININIRNKIVVEIPSNSIRKEDYRPIIEDAIISKAIEPKKRYKLRNSPAKGITLEVELVNSTAITNKETTPFQALFDELEPGIPYIPNLERYRAIGAIGEAIIPLEKRSKSLKFTSRTEECKLLAVLGSKTYLVYIPSRRAVLKTSTVKFIKDNTVLSQPIDYTALKGELVDLNLDSEGAVSPDPSNLNTEKPISTEIGPSKLEPYESSSDKPIFIPKPIEIITPNQPITNEPLDNSDLISEGDKMQLDYYKLLAKTSSYILSFVYKARKRVISKDSTPTTYKY
ncbi:hypothetical protein P8C59_003161 [Phyllachora maydis]|uniref:Reverse transcriptase Ty1/copia-type domain-containing protein n=1 Tax=Phyllachora maydis TaxID=1825666 RepID=A0AAD9I1A0_9PEZI|nr:hypothetical protein P8C59_003161 [Phyllachora maydis]